MNLFATQSSGRPSIDSIATNGAIRGKSSKELINKFTLENGNNHHRFISTCGQYIYNIAIIDYLQAYDFEKWGEHQIKVWLYRRDGALISATHPDPYARRFLHFMREHVIIN